MKPNIDPIKIQLNLLRLGIFLLTVAMVFSVPSELFAERIPNPTWICPNGLTWDSCGHTACGQKWLCTSDLRQDLKAYSEPLEGLGKLPEEQSKGQTETEELDSEEDNLSLSTTGLAENRYSGKGFASQDYSHDLSSDLNSGKNDSKPPTLYPGYPSPDQEETRSIGEDQTLLLGPSDNGSYSNQSQDPRDAQDSRTGSPRLQGSADVSGDVVAPVRSQGYEIVSRFLQGKEQGEKFTGIVEKDGEILVTTSGFLPYSKIDGPWPGGNTYEITEEELQNLKNTLTASINEEWENVDNALKMRDELAISDNAAVALEDKLVRQDLGDLLTSSAAEFLAGYISKMAKTALDVKSIYDLGKDIRALDQGMADGFIEGGEVNCYATSAGREPWKIGWFRLTKDKRF